MITIKSGIFQYKSGIKKYEVGKSSSISISIPINSSGNPLINKRFARISKKPIKDRLIAIKKKSLKFKNFKILSKFIYFNLRQFFAFLHLFLYFFSILFPFFLSNLEAMAPLSISPSIIVPIENLDLTSVIFIAPI